MPTQPNRNIQRLTLHVGVGTLASALSNVFSAVFLIRVGLAPAEVFLAFAAILALRFLIRPPGGTANNAVIKAGGLEIISAGGVESSTTVSSGGTLLLIGSAETDNDTLLGGAVVEYGSGFVQPFDNNASGVPVQIVILSGGILSGGEAQPANVVIVRSGGIASGLAIDSGASLIVSSGGTSIDATVSGGGKLTVLSGGLADPTVPNGGSVAPGPAAKTFPGNGVDLPDIAFGAQTTLAYSQNAAGTGGTLMVNDGRHAAAIALLGNYMAGSFVVGAGDHGGMLVTEASQATPPLLAHPRPT